MKYVISYDIVDDTRRRNVVKFLLGVAYRVQKSVFEGCFSSDEIKNASEKLSKIIDKKTDSIRFYPLCESCNKKIQIIGTGVIIEKINYIII